MANLINSNALTFDDVLLVPQYSNITSRKKVDISTELLGKTFSIPICSANMDTVTGQTMAEEMSRLGGFGCLHRYESHKMILKWIQDLKQKDIQAVPSIGIKPEDFDYALDYVKQGALAINIDIAHGDSEHMVRMVQKLTQAGIKVIAGNVATLSGALRLAAAGACAIKVGVGPGSMCTTRIVTGHGVPQLTAIEECSKIKKQYPDTKIIADGGIRNAGDCVKALAFGADMIMIGSLLAGTNETPGELVKLQRSSTGMYYSAKEYRGMASYSARESVAKMDASYVAEGESTFVDAKGPAKNIVDQLIGGIKSGLSYSGASYIRELQENADYVIITNNGILESRPHGIK